MAGPEGYVNSNPGLAALSHEMSVGLMYLDVGNCQRGLHYRSVTEIYVILKGQVRRWDGKNEVDIAGPMDCFCIPAGVLHRVRCYVTEEVEVIWLHDAIEKKGITVCYTMEEENTKPQTEEISVIKFNHLKPQWTGPNVREPGHLHWLLNWFSSRISILDKQQSGEEVSMGLMVVLPSMKHASHSGCTAELYIPMKRKALINLG